MAKNLFNQTAPLEGMSVVEPSNDGGRIHRLGFIEIIEDDTEKVAVDTEEMAPEDVDDNLHTWDSAEAAGEGRLRILTVEETKRQGFTLSDSCHGFETPNSIPIPGHHRGEPIAVNERKGWRSLRPASRPNNNK